MSQGTNVVVKQLIVKSLGWTMKRYIQLRAFTQSDQPYYLPLTLNKVKTAEVQKKLKEKNLKNLIIYNFEHTLFHFFGIFISWLKC